MKRKQKAGMTYTDAAGHTRRVTALQEKILYYRMEHPDVKLSDVSRTLKCSQTAVYHTTVNPACVAFENEIKAAVKRFAVMGLEERQKRLSEIARATITDVIDETGKVKLVDDDGITPTLGSRAVAEYEVIQTEDSFGRTKTRTKVKLHDPMTAIQHLDREDGVGRPDVLAAQQTNNTQYNIFLLQPKTADGAEKVKQGKSDLELLLEGKLRPLG